MAFSGKKESVQKSQEEEEYVDNNTQANAIQEIQEDDTRQHNNTRMTPPPNTYEIASASRTPTNIVALHSNDETNRGTWNLSSSATKVVRTIVGYANKKSTASIPQSPTPQNDDTTKEKKLVKLNEKGKLLWPYSCITIEDYVQAWEKGDMSVAPVSQWSVESNDKSKCSFTGPQRKNARASLWKHE